MIPIEVLNAWSATWWGFMARALIDASVLFVLVLAIWLPLRRKMSAQLAHGLFCLVLLKLVVPAPAAWPTGWLASGRGEPAGTAPDRPQRLVLPTTGDLGASTADSAGAPPVASLKAVAQAQADPARPAPARRPRLSLAAGLMIGWGCVATLLLLRFGLTIAATRQMIRNSDRLGQGWLAVDTEALRRAAGIRSRVRWAVSPRLHSPAVGGLIRPTVVIPPDLDDGLTPEQLSWVLLHELAHIRRGDLWVVAAQRVAHAFFFFHPAVYLANWLIDQLREYACDDAALAACEASRRACGEGFLTVVGRAVERPPAASAALGLFESRLLIRRRLVRILDNRRTVHQRLTPRATFALLAAALVALPYGRGIHASARPGPEALLAEEFHDDASEPVSYRPGEVWHRETEATGARATVLALTYSPDGDILATAGEGGAIVLRDAQTGRVTTQLEGHRDAVSALAFSRDGKVLVSGSYDRTVRIWNVAAARATAVLEGHTNWVFSVAISPDGRSVASAGHDKGVRLWDVASGRERAALSGHTASVRSVAFSPDGARLASGGADRAAVLWDTRTGARVARLEGHRGVVRAVAFSPDGATLATAGEDGEVRLWDVAGGRERAALTGTATWSSAWRSPPRGGPWRPGASTRP